jgi:hypothetical protein
MCANGAPAKGVSVRKSCPGNFKTRTPLADNGKFELAQARKVLD